MRISISWSGETSYNVAMLISKWIPSVVQAVTPFVSADEHRKGSAWFNKVKDQFSQVDFGIICLDRDNFKAPWLLFETGLLATRFDQAHICVVLVGDLSEKDIAGPFENFRSVKLTDKEDMRRFVQTLNRLHGTRMLSANALNSAFDQQWPPFEEACGNAMKKEMKQETMEGRKTAHQILEEINARSIRLAETMGVMSDNIKDLKDDLFAKKILSFPQKEIRKL